MLAYLRQPGRHLPWTERELDPFYINITSLFVLLVLRCLCLATIATLLVRLSKLRRFGDGAHPDCPLTGPQTQPLRSSSLRGARMRNLVWPLLHLTDSNRWLCPLAR